MPVGRLSILACALLAVSLVVGSRWERRLVVAPQDGMRVYAQSAGSEEPLRGVGTTQKITTSGGTIRAEYGFKNFNNDKLTARYEISQADYARSEAEWGYKQEDLDALKRWHDGERKRALAEAVAKGRSQQQLNDAIAMLKKQYEQKRRDYMASKGFRLLDGGVVEVDMPGLVKAHAPRVASMAKAIDDYAKGRRYTQEDTVGALTAMVQTAVMYKVPPNVMDGGVHTGGLWPPEQTLVKGWGDCDTKTGLLASLLRSWPDTHAIGVSLPDHYIMGIARVPIKGDRFVEYEGAQYVLVEPAGPAWLAPGTLDEHSIRLIETQEAFKIDPLF